MVENQRVVITGVGLTAPNGDNLTDFRKALLEGVSGIEIFETRYMPPVPAGVCHFDQYKHQTKKQSRRGTRAGAISIYCANEAVDDSGFDFTNSRRDRAGVFIGITEHGNVETENEVYNLGQYNNDVKFWTHHHNPRTVANNPAGEVTLNMGVTGPHVCLGAACAAGNIGLIYGVQMLRLGEVDFAIAGGVSESIHTFGIFASFQSQNALASHEDPTKASRPFDKDRNGIVVSEGGCLYTLERLEDARARGAKIYGEIGGYAYNSDATDFVLPNPARQAECMRLALERAKMTPEDIDIVNTHGTGTNQGDEQECSAIREVFGGSRSAHINNTKSFIGHAMGAAGALELAGNLPSFEDGLIHPTINLDNIDPQCALDNFVIDKPVHIGSIKSIINNSFGMLGINSVVVIKRFEN
ncbi:3-oxoacyl-[acyl-carrier-protein] synthase, KASII [hydrothermal vent metagenome]|uniref:3-oxoacyl-[acyl-carrier-protein] synthase, KASII n=1 Tax=hydrothermal vent metagenome TaxID=652676 RepID=A0A3B1BFN5_9ZZZZ